ncbi:AMP-binding protein [Agitococcus lubricus]|uniref:Long-chain-fatty-acid--CoA ligase n=1 Tax=Agitococcus lubricus TaxID=1077255 RepID=A0A2T5IX16_9GAMM|nr:AMP-binding protein [Agitococcus lubricus]PTQ88492.1 long-chain acyl-CoA synthetase [Agitococcus lubricus]
MDYQDFWQGKYPDCIARNIDTNIYPTLLDLFKDACRKYANKPAFSNMGRTLTFAELDKYSATFATWLQQNTELHIGDRIAIQLPNVLQYPIAVFGALRAGLVVVNTNPLYTAREMEHQFKDAGCKALLTLANFAHLVQEVLPRTGIRYVMISEIADMMPLPKRLMMNSVVKYLKRKVPAYNLPDAIPFTQMMSANPNKLQEASPKPEDIAVLQYTGGTTGIAKGAMLTHKSITSNMVQTHAFLATVLETGRETMVCPLPLYHIFAFGVSCIGMIMGMHTLLITNPRDIKGFIQELKTWPFTAIMGLNTLFVALMNHPEFKKLDFSRLKLTIAGGMAMQQQVALDWEKLTNCPVCEGYGMTESSPVISLNPPNAIQIGTIGLPTPNTEVRIVNEEGQDMPIGEAGELWARGPQLMKGYWQRAQATAETMTVDGWLKTGDIAMIQPDGYIKIVDRKKDMILVSGFNVYPNEIEEIAAAHAGVLESAAVGMPDQKSGEVVKLFVVKKDPELTEESLMIHLKTGLTAYKLPRSIVFKDELPKSPVGKILRRELRDKV